MMFVCPGWTSCMAKKHWSWFSHAIFSTSFFIPAMVIGTINHSVSVYPVVYSGKHKKCSYCILSDSWTHTQTFLQHCGSFEQTLSLLLYTFTCICILFRLILTIHLINYWLLLLFVFLRNIYTFQILLNLMGRRECRDVCLVLGFLWTNEHHLFKLSLSQRCGKKQTQFSLWKHFIYDNKSLFPDVVWKALGMIST